jgi:hypothetical protein
MPHAHFVMSTGRCSTQFLAKRLAGLDADILVEHEPLLAGYNPRAIFRKPAQTLRTLGGNVPLQRKLIQIEDRLAAGQSYVDTGWPTYAWLPYMADRFGAQFGFLHLVRNPFHTAASLLTHGLFAKPGKGNIFQNRAMVHGTDRGVFYAALAPDYPQFSAFEKNLFHWLEVNRFLADHHATPGFLGLVRYEDMFSGTPEVLTDTLSKLMNRPVTEVNVEPFDKVQRALSSELVLAHQPLFDAVMEMAQELGYAQDALLEASNVQALAASYRQRRI